MKESCPYCGEMTSMKKNKDGQWVSDKCEFCSKSLILDVPEMIEEKPDLKAPEDVELP